MIKQYENKLVQFLHHLCIKVKNAEKSQKFYNEMFGFETLKSYDIDRGGRIMHLIGDNTTFILELIEDQKKITVTDGVHIGIGVNDFEKIMKKIIENGICIKKGPIRIGNENLVFIEDLDGWIIEINDNLNF